MIGISVLILGMDESFELHVNYNGKEELLPAKLVHYGYTYRIEVEMNNAVLSFERDEEKNWRVLIDPGKQDSKIDANLVNAIQLPHRGPDPERQCRLAGRIQNRVCYPDHKLY